MLRWVPSGASPGTGWTCVPGFVRLYVYGGGEQAWATQRQLFLEREGHWHAPAQDTVEHSFAQQIVDGPGLAGALMADTRRSASFS